MRHKRGQERRAGVGQVQGLGPTAWGAACVARPWCEHGAGRKARKSNITFVRGPKKPRAAYPGIKGLDGSNATIQELCCLSTDGEYPRFRRG